MRASYLNSCIHHRAKHYQVKKLRVTRLEQDAWNDARTYAWHHSQYESLVLSRANYVCVCVCMCVCVWHVPLVTWLIRSHVSFEIGHMTHILISRGTSHPLLFRANSMWHASIYMESCLTLYTRHDSYVHMTHVPCVLSRANSVWHASSTTRDTTRGKSQLNSLAPTMCDMQFPGIPVCVCVRVCVCVCVSECVCVTCCAGGLTCTLSRELHVTWLIRSHVSFDIRDVTHMFACETWVMCLLHSLAPTPCDTPPAQRVTQPMHTCCTPQLGLVDSYSVA